MKILHSTTTRLNNKEFKDVSGKILKEFYRITPEIKPLYDIHINYIDDAWRIDFLPMKNKLPVIAVDTYTEQDDRGGEVLKVTPVGLTDIPNKIKFSRENTTEVCKNYMVVMQFILSLPEFEYILS